MSEHERKYQSRFGATRPISFSQMVSETILGRQAKLNGKNLPQRFWQLAEHRRWFSLQVMLCNSLLARFSPEVISTVLRSPEGQRICTLRNPQLLALLEAEVRKRETATRLAENAPRDERPAPSPSGVGAETRPPTSRPGNLFSSMT